MIDQVCEHGLLDRLRAARAAARARAFALGARPDGPLVIDLDATLVTAHSDKDGTSGTFKGGFGFHPLLAYLDTPDLPAGGTPLAGLLRPGNAGANDAADHLRVLPARDADGRNGPVTQRRIEVLVGGSDSERCPLEPRSGACRAPSGPDRRRAIGGASPAASLLAQGGGRILAPPHPDRPREREGDDEHDELPRRRLRRDHRVPSVRV